MDTIIAQATPVGSSAISVIRISGKDCLKILRPLIKTNAKILHAKMFRAEIKAGNISDDIMAVYFEEPKSFTGEDTIELYCHGSNFICSEIISELLKKGCRSAENGEFTRRAFLNGKLDLTQAEGIIDLINAESEAGCNSAFSAVKGSISQKIIDLQNQVTNIIAVLSAAVDYPEEDIEQLSANSQASQVKDIIKICDNLIDGFKLANAAREGIKIVIAGEPNSGKSTLFNTLIDKDRAIVTDIEGTTRDTIEEGYIYNGVKFVLIDTAGLRDSADKVEQLGIKRAKQALLDADVILQVSVPDKKFDYQPNANQKKLSVLNKIDLKSDYNSKNYDICVSAKNGDNIDNLRKMIYSVSNAQDIKTNEVRINNQRQLNCVILARQALERALEAITNNISADCVISDLNEAYRALGQITGVITSEQVVTEIFKRFCVGK